MKNKKIPILIIISMLIVFLVIGCLKDEAPLDYGKEYDADDLMPEEIEDYVTIEVEEEYIIIGNDKIDREEFDLSEYFSDRAIVRIIVDFNESEAFDRYGEVATVHSFSFKEFGRLDIENEKELLEGELLIVEVDDEDDVENIIPTIVEDLNIPPDTKVEKVSLGKDLIATELVFQEYGNQYILIWESGPFVFIVGGSGRNDYDNVKDDVMDIADSIVRNSPFTLTGSAPSITLPTATPTPTKTISKITPTPTRTPTFLFEGFDDINLFEGAYWEYSYEETSTYFNQAEPTKRGTMRIELVDSVDWTFKELGELTFYRTNYRKVSGDDYPLSWHAFEYLAAKDGVIYAGQTDGTSYWASTVFDSRDGSVYEEGFTGYFSANRKESVFEGMIDNQFIRAPAVVVSERYYKPECETVGGVRVCDDEYHDYTIREYYLPHIGFGGFYRSGTSIFSGGGYVDKFTSTMNVGLTDTNVIAKTTQPLTTSTTTTPPFEKLSFFEEELVGKWSRYHAYDGSYMYFIFNSDRTGCYFEIHGSSRKKEKHYSYWKLDPVGNNAFLIMHDTSTPNNLYGNDIYNYEEDAIFYGGYKNLKMTRSSTSREC